MTSAAIRHILGLAAEHPAHDYGHNSVCLPTYKIYGFVHYASLPTLLLILIVETQIRWPLFMAESSSWKALIDDVINCLYTGVYYKLPACIPYSLPQPTLAVTRGLLRPGTMPKRGARPETQFLSSTKTRRCTLRTRPAKPLTSQG